MIRAALLAVIVAGCAAQPPIIIQQQPKPPEKPTVSETLKHCPAAPAAVPVPQRPRTFDSVVQWANETDARRSQTVHALEICRAHVVELLRLFDAT